MSNKVEDPERSFWAKNEQMIHPTPLIAESPASGAHSRVKANHELTKNEVVKVLDFFIRSILILKGAQELNRFALSVVPFGSSYRG